MRYYYGPWPNDSKGVLCLTFDVDIDYAYTKGTQTWARSLDGSASRPCWLAGCP